MEYSVFIPTQPYLERSVFNDMQPNPSWSAQTLKSTHYLLKRSVLNAIPTIQYLYRAHYLTPAQSFLERSVFNAFPTLSAALLTDQVVVDCDCLL